MLDEREQSEMLDRARLAVLLDAAATPGSAVGAALATAIAQVADSTFVQVVNDAIRLRDKLLAWIGAAGSVDAAIAGLCDPLGITAADTPAQVEAEITNGPLLPMREWTAVADVLRTGGKTDKVRAASLAGALAETGAARIDNYLDVFFTKDRDPRDRVMTQPLERLHRELAGKLSAERDRLVPLITRRRAVRCREHTRALVMIANLVLERYRQDKDKRGLLDYDDLIGRSLDLLKRVDAAWVHYKLDLGIDHVLIDEAQDTSPQQWEIVSQLVSEFTAGAGARGLLPRSIFAVGDEKQSIFSFQGAVPDAFAEKRRAFTRDYTAAGLSLHSVKLEHSFRSLPIIVEAVDTVFKQEAAYRGLTADPIPTAHAAVRLPAAGYVEICEFGAAGKAA